MEPTTLGGGKGSQKYLAAAAATAALSFSLSLLFLKH